MCVYVCMCVCLSVCVCVCVLEQNFVASDARLRFPHFNFANGVQVDVKTMGAILVVGSWCMS